MTRNEVEGILYRWGNANRVEGSTLVDCGVLGFAELFWRGMWEVRWWSPSSVTSLVVIHERPRNLPP